MRELTDQQIDELVRHAQVRTRAGGHELDRLGLRRAEQDLLEEIMSTPVRPQAASEHVNHDEDQLSTIPDHRPGHSTELGDVRPLPVRPPRRRMRAVAGIAAAAAVLAAVAVPAVVFGGKDGSQVEIQNPAGPGNVAAGTVPRVLLDDPAWKLTSLDDSTPDRTRMIYTNGDQEFQINWGPAAEYQLALSEYRDSNGEPRPIAALGQTGALFTNSSWLTVVLPVTPGERTFFTIAGGQVDRSTFDALLGKLTIVPDSAWEAALPGSVVKPGQQAQVAAEMLTGVPLPPGFDATDLPTGKASDYYQFGAIVTGAVTCGWLKEYRTARAAQDETTMAEVDTAMSTSKHWAVLKKMDKQGDWPESIWSYAARVSHRQPISAQDLAQGLSCK